MELLHFFKKLLTPKQVALVEKGQSYVKKRSVYLYQILQLSVPSDLYRAVHRNVPSENALSGASGPVYCSV